MRNLPVEDDETEPEDRVHGGKTVPATYPRLL
jgi:hypothetical protein